jgi:hypothetical protein
MHQKASKAARPDQGTLVLFSSTKTSSFLWTGIACLQL